MNTRTAKLTIFLLAVCTATHASEWYGENLVQNAGFEEAGDSGFPAEWYGDKSIYERDTETAHQGQASLRFTNEDPGVYKLCAQPFEPEPGARYAFSVWIKSTGVTGDDTGATFCMEFTNQEGKYAGGSYSSTGAKGDAGWREYTFITNPVPEDAARGTIVCYVRQGMTGTAWWDDVSVRPYRGDPMDVHIVAPNYRNEITDAGPARVRVLVDTRNLAEYDLAVDDVALAWRMTGESGGPDADSGTRSLETLEETTIELPGADLAPETYDIAVTLKRKDSGAELSTRTRQVTRLESTPQRTSYLDEHNRLIRNGEPFFPLGMYWGSISKEELDVYADSAFNCLMPYAMPNREQMDLAHQHGLKVIYSLKDCYAFLKHPHGGIKSEADEEPFIRRVVEAYRDHPALLAWYLNDEAPLSRLDRLILHRKWVEALDPNHPTWSVLYQIDDIGGYFASCHAIGTDPYPIPNKPASMAGDWTRRTIDDTHNARAVWMVPQVFNWAAYKGPDAPGAPFRQPTIDEVRSMAWQCIAEGARGLIFYSWFNLYRSSSNAGLDFEAYWPQFKAVVREIGDRTSVLLSVEDPPAITTDGAPWLNWTLRRTGNTTHLIAVNNSDSAHSTSFDLPAKPDAIRDSRTSASLTMGEPTRLTLHFAPYEVKLYELTGL